MDDFEKLIILMSAAVLLVSLARKTGIPYPIALVIGGALLSLLPGVDFTYFDPNLILTVVLPPVLYYAAFWTSHSDFKSNFKHISSLALGLVIATTFLIGIFFKWLFPEYPWALAFAFGAIISPPDAVSATAVLKRFNIGPKLSSILEGESLVNDASALVIFHIAITALITGAFSWWEAGFDFFKMAVGGTLFGLALGYSVQYISRRYLEPVVGAFASLLVPYVVYILARILELSPILAVVASGIVSSKYIFKYQTPERRMFGRITWDMYIILLNCFIFVLIGSQLDEQTSHMSWEEIGRYTGYALAITLLMSLIRFAWVLLTYSKQMREGIVIGWAGMRGIVSLAAALALPLMIQGRQEVIYIAFCVIFFSLIIPGFTLGPLIRWLKFREVPAPDKSTPTRKQLAQVAEEAIHSLHVSPNEGTILKEYFNSRFRLWELLGSHKQLETARKTVIQAQRNALIQIWEHGHIDDKVLIQIEHELDLEETQTTRAEL
jgi:CPA1 family monovalent cation:H+ antiporter